MFYSNQILARKGPLGLVWIAAHLDRQLKRQQINNTSIPASVDTLLDSEVPLALRLSGQLLLGVVRIYARKVNYLQQDCNDALVKIRVALRPADGVNLPPGSHTAPVESITLLAPKHVAKAGRGGRKAAAGATNRDGNGAGAVGIDGFDIDVDDLYWEQDVLLGRDGAGGLAGFEFGAGFDLGLSAPSGSGPMSQDISGVFGMHSSQDYQEVFDVEDEEAAAVWDLDEIEVERLRAVASSQQPSSGVSGLLGLGGTPGVEGPQGKGGAAAAAGTPAGSEDDMQLQPPPDLDDELPASPQAAATANTAAAAHGSPVEGQTPVSRMAQSGPFADEYVLDLLPPTPATNAGDGQDGDLGGTAGYTGGTAAGYTPGSAGLQDADMGALLPATPALSGDADMEAEAATAEAGRSEQADQQHQQQQEGEESMELDQTAAAEDQQQDTEQHANAAAAAAAAATKTFERRNTRQQQQVPAATDAAEQEAGMAAAAATEAAAAAAKAKAAKQKRSASAQLLGQKRPMVIDAYPEDAAAAAPGSASKRGAGKAAAAAARRQPATELPAGEIRALLADRTPLLDLTRLQSQGKRLRVEAALARSALTGSSSLAVPAAGGAAAAAAGGADALQLRLALSNTAAAAGPGRSAGAGSSAALAVLLAGPSSRSTPAAAAAGVGRQLGLGGSLLGLGHGLGVLGGLGLQLPAELQELFVQAAAAGAAAVPGGGAAAEAPVAAPDEIEMEGDGNVVGLAGAAVPGVARLSAGGAVTRSSLSLSVVSTPGSTAAKGATPGTGDAGATAAAAAAAEETPAAAADVGGSLAPGSIGGISSGFGCAGYTPGSFAGDDAAMTNPGSAGGVLQPLDAADVAMASQQQQNGEQGFLGAAGTMDAEEFQHEDYQEDFAHEEGLDKEGLDKENPPVAAAAAAALAASGKAATGAATAAVGLIGSSARSTQEALLLWPADAETLQEQEEENANQPGDGGLTSRTRLVMRHLQHTAAAAVGGSSAATAAAAAVTPASGGSRRRISAVPPPSLSAGGKARAAAAASLSFNGLTQGHNRLDACRWFYEVLVLGNKGLVDIKQEEAYGDIIVTPNLAAMARI